ncbi:hypothetical protein OHC60_22425 [Escherichia coli]|uniref:hypothetical protein n=1 Tax=Escherichia coli TaxID=562 RepID=UPI0022377C25|nr:hypothetical protein [Escherichia coli]MCW7135204.1 hypothetical protein [Escherichia coli]
MKDNLEKLIENTLKDILLANAALTFIFAIPMAIISRHGMGITIWFITVLIAPALCAVGAWLVSRTSGHAEEFFHRRWAKRIYVFLYSCGCRVFACVLNRANNEKSDEIINKLLSWSLWLLTCSEVTIVYL